MNILQIISQKSKIATIEEMHEDMNDGDTLIYVCDNDNKVYWFTKKYDTIWSSEYMDDTSLADMIDRHWELVGE